MSNTLSGSLSTPVTLASGGAYTSPLTITGTIQVSSGAALRVTSPWDISLSGDLLGATGVGNLLEATSLITLQNSGTIAGGYSGVNLYVGGGVTNSASAVIRGAKFGIDAYAAGQSPPNGIFFSVSNAGYIGGQQQAGVFGGYGAVSNTGTGTIYGGGFGVLDVTTVTNSGVIHGRKYDGVGFETGGTLANDAGGTITGGITGVYSFYNSISDIYNAGAILGGGNNGVEIGSGALTNSAGGTISGGYNGVYLRHPASLTNAGVIIGLNDGGTGVTLSQGGDITNNGTIEGYTGIRINSGSITNAGFIAGETLSPATGLLTPSVTATAVDFTAVGNFIEDETGVVLGSIIGDGGTLWLNGGNLAGVSGFAADVFGPNAAATLATRLAGLGTLSGFAAGDTLVLTDQTASGGIFLNHELTLSNHATLNFTGSYAENAFNVTTGANGTLIELVTCFRRGTHLASARGPVPVELLQIGDELRTVDAGLQKIKWIGQRDYAAPFTNHAKVLPIRIQAGAIAGGVPSRDLFVSPGHAICIDGALIHAALLTNGVSITQLTQARDVTYFHIEMENHEILLAEDCPAESFMGEHFRAQFHNAAEYARLYPGQRAPDQPCLAPLQGGFLLDSIRRRLAARAGLTLAHAPGGPLRGFVDEAGPARITGWAQDEAAPEAPVCLDVLADGKLLARTLANHYRADLQAAGLGSGRHAFEFMLPTGTPGVIMVRRACDGVALALTEAALTRAA